MRNSRLLGFFIFAAFVAVLFYPRDRASADYPITGSQAANVVVKSTENSGVHTPHTKHVSSSFTTSPVTLSTSATLIIAANAARQSVMIDNRDSSISIYVGPSGVTTATGKLVRAGQATTIYTTAAVYGVAASGTPVVDYLAEND